MLFAVSGLENCPVKASDGDVGAVKDFLFDDQTWTIRWIVVDASHWLPGRQVLIHPSAFAPLELPPKPALPMMSPGDSLELAVNLTKHEIEAGPHRITAAVTRDSVEELGLAPGVPATAAVKATSVMVDRD